MYTKSVMCDLAANYLYMYMYVYTASSTPISELIYKLLMTYDRKWHGGVVVGSLTMVIQCTSLKSSLDHSKSNLGIP